MATPDFSKIWGSAAEQKYNFSDDDYVRGWQFIGSTPPSRQMFDAWMRSGDEKNKYLYDIMSDAFGTTSPGGIAIDDTKVPTSDKNNLITLLSNLANVEKGIIGGTSWRDNPAITLAAMSAFVQQLAAGSDVKWSGNTWKNKKLGMTGLLAQNGYISLGPNYGGQIIQWGTYNVICNRLQGPPDGRYEGRVVHTFPLSFSKACYAALANVAADVIGPGDETASVRQTTTGNFQLWGGVSSANATITASCMFIGR